MGILTIILGVVLVAGGFFSIFTPFAAFLAAGYIIGIMLFIYGIFSLIRAIQLKAGAFAYVTSILALFVGFLAVFRPGGTLVLDMLILIFVAIWFLVQGLSHLIISISHRKEISGWGFGVAAGIFGIFAGVISLAFPHVEMFAVGILIGIFLLEAGFSLITVGSVFGNIRENK